MLQNTFYKTKHRGTERPYITGVVGSDSTGPRFGKTHMRRSAVPAFICSGVALVTYITPGPNFLKTLTAHAFLLKLCEKNHIGIFDVLTTVITENADPLPSEYVTTTPGQLVKVSLVVTTGTHFSLPFIQRLVCYRYHP